MSYSLLVLTTVYDGYLRARLDGLGIGSAQSYEEARDRFVADRITPVDAYRRYLSAEGVRVEEHYANVAPLQQLWVAQNRRKPNAPRSLAAIVVEQVRAFEPDVIFIDDLYFFDDALRRAIRAAAPPSLRLIGWRASATRDLSELAGCDVILTATRHFLDELVRAGMRAEYLPLGFDEMLSSEGVPDMQRDLPFTFTGTLDPLRVHTRRYDLVRSLLPITPLEVWSNFQIAARASAAKRLLDASATTVDAALAGMGFGVASRESMPLVRRATGARRDYLPIAPEYASRFHAPVFGRANARVLGRSRTTLNAHSDWAGDSVGNVRLFEATGLGACLITERRPGLAEFFAVDEEIVTYGGPEECAERVLYLLEHDDVRRGIADRGRTRTYQDHTQRKRVAQFDAIVHSVL